MIPKFKAFFRPYLEILREKGPMSKDCLTKEIAIVMNLSQDAIKQKTKAGSNVLSQRVHWTTVYMMKAGMIKRVRRGIYEITDSGKDLLEKNYDIIDNNILASLSKEFSGYQYIKKSVDHSTD